MFSKQQDADINALDYVYEGPHLFIVMHILLFGFSNDAFQLVEAFLHFSESHASWLLLTADSL